MKQHTASRTAEYMAFFRALESLRPAQDRLFEDHLAQKFIRPSLRTVIRLARLPKVRRLVSAFIDRRWPGSRPSGIARTRYIDEALMQALNDGIEQLIILGAGFDCRAYRIPGIERIQVYEVDHPSTLQVKRERLRSVLGELPRHVTFVEIDFNQQNLADVLAAAGFDRRRRSFFIWEGVTNYLSAQAVDTTLRVISGAKDGSQLVFTYIHRGVLDNAGAFASTTHLMQVLQKAQELWTFGLYPTELLSYLKVRGFDLMDEIGSIEYGARHANSGCRYIAGHEFYRIALARVKP